MKNKSIKKRIKRSERLTTSSIQQRSNIVIENGSLRFKKKSRFILHAEDFTDAEWLDISAASWVRIQADMALGGYRIMKAKGDLGEPEWPSLSLSELLDVAFKDRVISSEDHPIFNKLLGRL